jgi:hypothetical protein
MEAELRELMVYNCPPELGDLYTRVYAMMEKMKKAAVSRLDKKKTSRQNCCNQKSKETSKNKM